MGLRTMLGLKKPKPRKKQQQKSAAPMPAPQTQAEVRQPMLDRKKELLKHITTEQRGIEIGPYHNPLTPRRLGFQSISLDVFDASELRQRAALDKNISPEQAALIEDVDLQGSAGDIADLVRARHGNEHFDYVLSSHNLEHLPDPIRFLQGCEQVLKPGGVVSMAIPDHRYCFDFYRPVTELSEWIDAFHGQRKKPTPGQVFRHIALHSLLDGKIAWSPQNAAIPMPAERLDEAFESWRSMTRIDTETPYRDAHCWAFTPASFELLLADARYLGLLTLETLEVSHTNGCEFYTHLRNPSGNGYKQDRAEFYRKRAEIMERAANETAWRLN